jgi:hypothetical protein
VGDEYLPQQYHDKTDWISFEQICCIEELRAGGKNLAAFTPILTPMAVRRDKLSHIRRY